MIAGVGAGGIAAAAATAALLVVWVAVRIDAGIRRRRRDRRLDGLYRRLSSDPRGGVADRRQERERW